MNLKSVAEIAAEGKHSRSSLYSWLGKGYVTAYQVPGRNAVLIDTDELERNLGRLPSSRIRTRYRKFGPNAVIRTLEQTAGGAQ